ncbi:hypothetical protein ABPG72_011851 [Tetrahymena utriculariae]
MSQVENILRQVGENTGLGSALLELAGELGGFIFLAYKLSQVNKYKCEFVLADEKGLQVSVDNQSLKSIYVICEDVNPNDLSLNQCYKYDNLQQAEESLNFINGFSNSYLLGLGIVWILIMFTISFIKCYHNNFSKEISLENETILLHVEGAEFMLTYIISTLIIPVVGVDYKNQCLPNIIKLILPVSAVYYLTYVFLAFGMIVYIINLCSEEKFNPILVIIYIPAIVFYCIESCMSSSSDQTDEERKKTQECITTTKYIFILIYGILVIFSYIFFCCNAHPAMIVFNTWVMIFSAIQILQKEKKLQNHKKHQQPK